MTGLLSLIVTCSRRHAGVALMLMFMLLPAGLAQATDFEEVERRLAELVVDGELSLAEANHMMESLRDLKRDDDDDDDEREERGHHALRRFDHWVKQVTGNLHEAVESGKLKEADAWKRWDHFKEKELAPRLKAAVKEGHLSEEAAMRFWRELEKGERHARENAEHQKGESTKRREHEKSRESSSKTREQPDWDGIKRRIEGAVKAGKITREEANKHYEQIKKGHAASRGKHGENNEHQSKHQPNLQQKQREHMEAVTRKIREAVRAGKLTEKEAREKMEAIRKSLHHGGKKKDD